MGFFSAIIGDSQRPVGRTASAASLRVTPAEKSLASANSDRQGTLAPKDSSLSQSETAEKTFWEEDFRKSGATGATAQPSTLEDHQVVGPSLSENTENSDLAKAPEEKRSFPVIEKQKQAGLKNRRAVTVQMNRDQNLHGSLSFSRENSSSKDSSVVESGSKHPEQSARGKSVDVTHRSRQAGQITRAGATTPPNSNDAAFSRPPPDDLAGESTGNTPFPSEDRDRLKVMTIAEKIVSPTARSEAQGAPQETPASAAAETETGDSRMRAPLGAPEVEGMEELQRFEPLGSNPRTMPTATEAAPMQIPVEVRFQQEPSAESHPDSRLREPAAEAVHQKPLTESSGPKVHIGLLEVVVLAPEKQLSRGAPPASEGQNLASRNYLRNL